MEETKTIYDLCLHERAEVGDPATGNYCHALRVPGGWIYEYSRQTGNWTRTVDAAVFVPFDNRFQKDRTDEIF